jgi:4'-phosphopantetheinyl transferase EntD
MNGDRVSRKLREMMPQVVCVAAGEARAMPLTARERQSLGTVRTGRLREFESGRAYAKRALGMLGIDNVDLPIGPNRSPVWPAGIVGSITHARCGNDGMYAAAIARADTVLAVGIDLEIEDSLTPDVWSYVLTQRELERILVLRVGIRSKELQCIWGAKEAAAKAVTQRFEPSEIEIDRDPESGEFVAEFLDSSRSNWRSRVLGQTAYLDRLFIATVVVPRGTHS